MEVRAKLSQEFRTRIGETYSRIELECFSEEIRMESTISTKDLKSKLDQKQVTVVEMLAPERYREAHIPGALNIPPEGIKELAPQLLPNKNAEIITYCTNNH
jgi:Rhodanese-like domain